MQRVNFIAPNFFLSCEFQGISSNVAQDYCWIHGSSYIRPEYQVGRRSDANIIRSHFHTGYFRLTSSALSTLTGWRVLMTPQILLTTSGSPSCSQFRFQLENNHPPKMRYLAYSRFIFNIFQAAIFYFPYKVWRGLEGGLMASFGTDGKSPVTRLIHR